MFGGAEAIVLSDSAESLEWLLLARSEPYYICGKMLCGYRGPLHYL